MLHYVRAVNMIAVAGSLGNSGFDASRVSDHVAQMYTGFVDAIPYFARSRALSARADADTDDMVREWRRMDEEYKRRRAEESGESGDDA